MTPRIKPTEELLNSTQKATTIIDQETAAAAKGVQSSASIPVIRLKTKQSTKTNNHSSNEADGPQI
jgi:hypothetical protein